MIKPHLRIRVYHKIIFPFLLIIILGILTTLPYGVTITHRLNTQKVDKELVSVTEVTANYFERRLEKLLAYAEILLGNTTIETALSEKDTTNLTANILPIKIRLSLDLVAAYDARGNRFFSLGPEEAISGLDEAKTIPQTLMGIHSKTIMATDEGIFLLAAAPNEVLGKGMNGLLMCGFLMDEDFMSFVAAFVEHDVAFVSVNRDKFVSNNPSFSGHLHDSYQNMEHAHYAVSDLILNNEPYRMQGKELKLNNINSGEIIVAAPMKEIYAFRNRILMFMLTVALLGALAASFSGIYFARMINEPIHRLVTMAEAIKKGDLDVRIDTIHGDELGDLTISFNRMAQGLKENVREVEASREKITKYAMELEENSIRLQRDKKEIETILHSIRDGLMMVDNFGKISAANQEALKIIGLPKKDLIGRGIQEVLASFFTLLEESDSFKKAVDFSSGHTRQEKSFEITVKEPKKTIYLVKIYPVFEENSFLLGWVITWTNITREKEIEEMKNNFLATISHELRTPLTSIKGSLNLLIDGNLGFLSQDQKEFIKIANRNSDRLASLVDNILDLARMDAGALKFVKVKCDLLDLSMKAIGDIKTLALSKNLNLDLYSSIKSAPIIGVPERVRQLIGNLVNNAIKFSPEGSLIEVKLKGETINNEDRGVPRGRYFRMDVIDQGQGIPADQISKIFDRFHQADMTITRAFGGSGLGLAISKTIVEEHGGAIWAENRQGGGSRFVILWPRRPIEKGAEAMKKKQA